MNYKKNEPTNNEAACLAQNGKAKNGLSRWGTVLFCALIISLLTMMFSCSQDGGDDDGENGENLQDLIPVDEEAAAAIDSMEGYSPDDTWVFYLYLVGSNLESGTSMQLSDLVKYLISDQVSDNMVRTAMKDNELLLKLVEEVEKQGQELPYNLFAPSSDLNNNTANTNKQIYVQGDASKDLHEYMSVDLPENVKFVVQTGGAPAWADSNINPNRTQRFLIDSEGTKEIFNGPISNMGDPDTLAEFLKFSDQNYPADHQVVILWNHGGGDTGFGNDDIFSDMLTLPELREAFAEAFTLDAEDPPLEMIYFACCLMSNAEVLEYFDGTAKYMVAAEEVTFTVPGACSGWLEEFVKDTGINGAQLGKMIIDHYAEGIIRNKVMFGGILPTTMNLIDMRRAGEVFDAYGDFAQAALKAQIEDPSMIMKIADAAAPSIFLANNLYKLYNLIDLTLFMEEAAEYLPEEANAVIDAVEEVMIYQRATEYLIGAGGISVYYPYHLESTSSILKCLHYLDSVCTNMDISAMYYYKMTGCLNDEYQQHCTDSGYGTAKVLEYNELSRLRGAEPETDDEGRMIIELTELEDLLIQDVFLDLTAIASDYLLYFGEDRYVDASTNRLCADLPTHWITIDEIPFAVEVINTDDENIQYRTEIFFNSIHMDMILNYSYETEKMTVLGVRNSSYQAATLDRSVEPLTEDSIISPVYTVSDLYGGNINKIVGPEVRYGGSDDIADAPLLDGTYITRIKLLDMRGDVYFTKPVRFTVENGVITEAMFENEFSPAKIR